MRREACLLERTVRAGFGLEVDFAEGGFVLANIILEDIQQGFGLLGAEVDALEILDIDLIGSALGSDAEHQKEVPKVGADLHAIRVTFAIVGPVD